MKKNLCDLITRIRNAGMAKKINVTAPYSKLNYSVCDILRENGYLHSVEVSTDQKGHKILDIQVKYFIPKGDGTKYVASEIEAIYDTNIVSNHQSTSRLKLVKNNHVSSFSLPSIKSIKMISTPGYKSYKSYKDFCHAKVNTFGMLVISTSKGIMTDYQAYDQRIGGQLILEVF